MKPSELKQYTVRIKAEGNSGTGFFVASGLILTCAHVVTKGDSRKLIESIKVYWKNTEYTSSNIELPTDNNVDLALLELPITNHPQVFLDEILENGDSLYSVGYTDDYPNGEPRDFVYTGLTGDEDNSSLMTFRGEQVQSGFSGAPLLNKKTGKICGLIKRSRDIYNPLGGRGVPISVIFEHFPQLKPNTIPNNPFNNLGGRIDDPQLVFGRDKEVNRIFEILNCGSSVAIIGEAEIGKSSLLKLVEYQAPIKLNFPRQPIYLNLGNVSDEEDFYFALCDLVDISLSKGYRLSRELKKHKLLLILDNVEKMAWNGFTNQIRSQIRALADGTEAPLRLVIAANKPLNRLFSDSSIVSPFENICLEEPIYCWDEATVNSFIYYHLQNNPISFTELEVNQIITDSKGYPKQVMDLCNKIYSRYLQ